MSNREMLQEFLNDEFFKEIISLVTRSVSYVKGAAVTGGPVTTSIEAIVQVIKDKELINLGLGQYTDNENYSVITETEIDQTQNNYILFQGKTYKIVKMLSWRSYGFRKYVISQYNETNLNDN